jgi:F-type H+-transporting ATPase subunit gamma
MKKILILSLLFISGWMSAQAVDLNKENRDPEYVKSIVSRSQKIVDKLGLTDAKIAEDVRNVIANRYFELNDIYEVRDAKVKKVKESGLTGEAKNEGLAGAYNTNVSKKYLELLKRDDERGIVNITLTVGRKASQLASRLKDTEVIGSYDDLPDHPGGVAFRTVLNTILEQFTERHVDAVTLVYTDFVSSVVQEARWQRLLPAGTTISSDEADDPEPAKDVKYEPTAEVVLSEVVRRMIGARLFQALLDARASEHSMRMIAMKNATDNASDLIDDLTLAMNKARQGAITQKLAEISGGVEALND